MINLDFKDIEIMPLGGSGSNSGGGSNVNLSNYYTKSEVDAKIIDDVHYIDYSTYLTADDFTQLQAAINNGSVIIVNNLPIIPFNESTVYNVYSVTNTGITLMCVSSQLGLSNGTKTNITYNTILITFTNSGGKSYNTYGTAIDKIGDGTKFLSDNGEYIKLNIDSLDSRVSALENEISGITETITELNNMVV